MKKKNIVKSNHEFQTIIGTGKKTVTKYFIIYQVNSDDVRFGISVGKKLGNAVTRNKVKRQIRSMLHEQLKTKLQNGHYIIIAKKKVLTVNYVNLQNDLEKGFKKAKIKHG